MRRRLLIIILALVAIMTTAQMLRFHQLTVKDGLPDEARTANVSACRQQYIAVRHAQ